MAKKKITALQVLSKMEEIERQAKSPSINPNYIVGSKYTDKKANGLTKAIIKFINLSGQQAERINTQGRMIDKTKIVKDVLGHRRTIGSVEWQKGTGTRGSADISATVNGMSVKIEVKIGRDKMSEYQEKYQEHITKAGGIYIVAKTFEDFLIWYVGRYGRPEIMQQAIDRLKT